MIDRRTYTEADWAALRAKIDNPQEKVICPRCGKELEFKDYGSSYGAECPTEGCIFGGVRGI